MMTIAIIFSLFVSTCAHQFRIQIVNQTALDAYHQQRNTSALCEYLPFLCR